MRTLFVVAVILTASLVLAQTPPPQMQQPQLSPEAQQYADQLSAVGCNAERLTAAQTIAAMQKQIEELQKKADPPKSKSGATKH